MVAPNTLTGTSQCIAAVGQLGSTILQYQTQKSALDSQMKIENWRFQFAQYQLGKEAKLMEDVENIAANKRGATLDLAKAVKAHSLAEAKYKEMKKTQKAASLNTKAILAKRDRAFYGSPIRAS